MVGTFCAVLYKNWLSLFDCYFYPYCGTLFSNLLFLKRLPNIIDVLFLASQKLQSEMESRNNLNFLNFMRRKTLWKFSSMKIGLQILRVDGGKSSFDVLSFFHQFESLFWKSVTDLVLVVPPNSTSSINNLCQNLSRSMFRKDTRMQLCFQQSVSNVQHISTHHITAIYLVYHVMQCLKHTDLHSLTKFTNINNLCLTRTVLHLDQIAQFPSLQKLSITSLEIPDFENEDTFSNGSYKKYPSVTDLCLNCQKVENIRKLPEIINKSFHNLVYFHFYYIFSEPVASLQFETLPVLCNTLSVPSHALSHFVSCERIKNLKIEVTCEKLFVPIFTQCFFSTFKFSLSVLNLVFSYRSVELKQVVLCVSDVLKLQTYLEVLSVRTNNLFVMDNDGDENMEKIWEKFHKIAENHSVKFIILGRLVAELKCSLNGEIIRKLDSLDQLYCWSLRTRNNRVIPIESQCILSALAALQTMR